MNRRTKFAALGAAIALGAAGVGVGSAYASVPDSSTGVATTCALTGVTAAHALLVVDKEAGGACPTGYHEVSLPTKMTETTTVVPSSAFAAYTDETFTCPSGVLVNAGWGAPGYITFSPSKWYQSASDTWTYNVSGYWSSSMSLYFTCSG